MLTAMGKVQSVDRKTYFLCVGDVNSHHEKRFGFSTTNLHGRTARDLASSSDYEQIFTEPIHIIDGGVLELVLTFVPNILGVGVGSPI